MRGDDTKQPAMFSYITLERRVPADHPLRGIRRMTDRALERMSGELGKLYAVTGRPSIAPERLLRALLLMVLYSVRSERQLMEQLDYNLLFRWFVGLEMDDEVWDVTVFTKNRERLIVGEVSQQLLAAVLGAAREKELLSAEHFTVDGTLIQAWAASRSFQEKSDPPAPGKGSGHGGEVLLRDKVESKTDPEARLFRKGKGKESKLSFMGHVLIENRHGLVISTRYTQATGTAEREAAEEMIREVKADRTIHVTLGGDKNYDTADFVNRMREAGVTPHVAQNDTNRKSAIDLRTIRHPGYEISQRKRKLVEEGFGWLKTVGLLRKIRHKGLDRGGWVFTFTNAVYNLIRIRNLVGEVC